jgi:5,10-methylenetetrahydromethanopterin reductase
MATSYGFMMGLSPREPIGRFGELARSAEEVGFDAAWLADSQLYTKNVYVGLALAAAQTRTIKLGPGVTNPITRHLTVTANAIAGIDEVSGGRAVLGLGAGDAAVFPLGRAPAGIEALRNAIKTPSRPGTRRGRGARRSSAERRRSPIVTRHVGGQPAAHARAGRRGG